MLTWINKYQAPLITILVFIFLALFFIVYFLLVTNYYPSITDSGSFGDMFGAVSAVFSGLAFLGVVYTIVLQRKELQNTTETQKKSEQILKEQNKSLEKTAKLNALNAILQSLGPTLLSVTTSIHPDPHQRDEINQEIEKIKQEIKKEIEEK